MTTPTTWRKVQLGSLGDFRNGVNFGKDKKGEGIRLINVKDIFSDIPKINFESLDKVALANQKGIEKYYVQARDIFFVRSSVKHDGVGLVSMAQKSDDETVHCGFVIRLRLNSPDVDPQFLTYILRSPLYRKTIIGISSGVAITNISQDSLSTMLVDLPPLPTQRKIASLLITYDNLIENNTQRIKILEEMAQALYREWFVKFRFPGHEKVKMVESEIGRVPEGWELTTLGRLIEFKKGKKPNATQPTPDGGVIPALLIDSLRGAAYEYARPEKLVTVCFSDTIMVMDGSGSGEVFIGHEGAVGSTLGRYRASEGCGVGPYWIYLYFVGNQADIRGKNVGAAIPHANKDYINSMAVAGPSDQVAADFESIVEPMFALIRNFKAKNANLRRTRDLLLPKLISGEVDVENIDVQIPNNGSGVT